MALDHVCDHVCDHARDARDDVWEHLQQRGMPTFDDGTNPLTDLFADACATLGEITPEGECLHALARLSDAYYGRRALSVRDAGLGEYAPPRSAPSSVRQLFADRHAFLWQRDLERALMDATEWATADRTISF